MEINKLKQATLDAHLRSLAKGSTALDAGRHSDGQGLYLLVSDTGAASWVYMWKVGAKSATGKNQKRREMGLGSFSGQGAAFRLSLAEARAKVAEVRSMLAKGIDPLAAKDDAKLAKRALFSMVLASFLKEVPTAKSWKRNAAGVCEQIATWEGSFAKHAPLLLKTPVDDIDVDMVLAILLPLWTRKIGEDMRNRIEQVLDYAAGHGHRKGLTNAAAWKGTRLQMALIAKPSKKFDADGTRKTGHAAMSAAATVDYVATLRQQSGMGAKALLLLILTGVRTDEAREAKWSEFDLDAGRWTIPANRMKARIEHVVPLSTQAVELLRSVIRIEGNDFVFASTGKNRDGSLRVGQCIGATALKDKLNERHTDVTVHGFRSTFRDWIGDTLRGYNEQDFEFCLAHILKGAEAAYRKRTSVEKRGEIMQAWANFACGVAANVATLPLKQVA